MLRRLAVLAIASVALVGLVAGPALAVTNYSLTQSSGATFLVGTSNNLFPGVVDDQVVQLTTSSSGAQKLPFKIRFYGSTYSSIWVSSNGNVQIGGTGNTAFSNDCLPSSTITGKLIAPFWDDLYMDSNDLSEPFPEGVYVKKQGTAPNRRFTISWQGHLFSDAGAHVLAQVTFFESSNTIRMIYGQTGGASATIGVQQSSTGLYRQFTCNSGTNVVSPGTKLTFNR